MSCYRNILFTLICLIYSENSHDSFCNLSHKPDLLHVYLEQQSRPLSQPWYSLIWNGSCRATHPAAHCPLCCPQMCQLKLSDLHQTMLPPLRARANSAGFGIQGDTVTLIRLVMLQPHHHVVPIQYYRWTKAPPPPPSLSLMLRLWLSRTRQIPKPHWHLIWEQDHQCGFNSGDCKRHLRGAGQGAIRQDSDRTGDYSHHDHQGASSFCSEMAVLTCISYHRQSMHVKKNETGWRTISIRSAILCSSSDMGRMIQRHCLTMSQTHFKSSRSAWERFSTPWYIIRTWVWEGWC